MNRYKFSYKKKTSLALLMALVFATGCGASEVAKSPEVEEIEETTATPEVESIQEENEDYKKAYMEWIDKLQAEREDQENDYAHLTYALIDFDGDDTPELVSGLLGYYVYLHTYKDGELIEIIDNWAYGAGGNAGYQYAPKMGIVYNINSDMAGAEMYETYWKWDPDTLTFEDMNDNYLMQRFYYDINEDGVLDWNDIEEGGYTDEPTYFYGENEVTMEEYESHCYRGELEEIVGDKSYEEIKALLSMEN